MTTEITSEAELLQASLTGNREAFGTIVERYQSLICGITYSATGDPARSEELAQEAFIRAWRQLRQLKDFGSFRGWLCTIARNLVRKSIKEKQRDVVGEARPLEDMGEVKSAEPGPVEATISREQEAVVWAALRQIPEQFREPMVLFYREQQSVSQVAGGLGLSEDVVKKRLSRGRKLLRAEVTALAEEVIGRTGPGKIFTVAVVAALPAVTAEAAGTAVAGVAAKGLSAGKTAFLGGLGGAVLGPILGLLGGLFGTWVSIRQTKSPREKRFVTKMAIITWVALFMLVGLPLILMLVGVIPKWAYWSLFAVLFVLLVPAIIRGNRRLRQIQAEDGTYAEPTYRERRLMVKAGWFAVGEVVFLMSVIVLFLVLMLKGAVAKEVYWMVYWPLMIAHFVLIVASTLWVLRRQHQIQQEEGTHIKQEEESKGGIRE